MADHVFEIPLPGRKFRGPTTNGTPPAAPVAVPYVVGQENYLLVEAIHQWLEPCEASHDQHDSRPPSALPQVLAIHGPSGTGKTHLVRGLVGAWQQRKGEGTAEYFTAREFRQALAEAIKQDTVTEFRQRVRERELLAIDDLDHLPREEYVQQELRYTIDDIAEHGGLLVVASSRAVSSLRNLPADVQSRLAAGLVLPARPPSLAVRKRLISHVSALLGRPLSEPAVERLAAVVTGTANHVFGALVEVDAAAAELGPEADDLACVERYLAQLESRRPSMRLILRRVARYYNVPQYVIKSSSRRKSVVLARSMAIYLAREIGELSYEQIGQALGGRDHSTIIHNHRKIAGQQIDDVVTRAAVDELTQLLADR